MLGCSLRTMVMLLMLGLQFRTSFTRAKEPCECKSKPNNYMSDQNEGSELHLKCCNINNSSDISITWYFNNTQLKNLGKLSQDCYQKGFHGDQFLERGPLTKSDEGFYNCVFSNADGSNDTYKRLINIHLKDLNDCKRKPSNVKIEAFDQSRNLLPPARTNTNGQENITLHVWRGANITLKCSGQICGDHWKDGSKNDNHIIWYKYNSEDKSQGKLSKESKDNHVHEDEIHDENGKVSHVLHISVEQEEDFAKYTCFVHSKWGKMARSVILTYKIPVLEIVLVLLIFLIGFLLFLGFLWWHCRIPWLLYYRNTLSNPTGSGNDINKFEYDVLIVHGESSTIWVWNVLKPQLEKYDFSCCLLDRDIFGGEDHMSAISSRVKQCLRVLVVLTPCVQDELSEKWALLQGYSEALHTNTRIFAIILQNITTRKSKTFKLKKMLDKVTKIRVPPVLQNLNSQEIYKYTNSEPSGAVKTDLSPDYQIPLSETSAYVSNECQNNSCVISTSNAVVNQDLESITIPGKLMHQDSTVSEISVPGSPCSTTPFILPSPERMTSDDPSVTGSVCACMRVVCCGDTKERFWQQVRLQMHPVPLSHTKRVIRHL